MQRLKVRGRGMTYINVIRQLKVKWDFKYLLFTVCFLIRQPPAFWLWSVWNTYLYQKKICIGFQIIKNVIFNLNIVQFVIIIINMGKVKKKIPPRAWMFVCCECCVLPGRGLCDWLIARPEESYRLWRIVVCDLETSYARRL